MSEAFGTRVHASASRRSSTSSIPRTHELVPAAADVLAATRPPGRPAGHEAYAAQIELRTTPCADAAEARAALAENRAAAAAAGATLMGIGLHPTDTWERSDSSTSRATTRWRDVDARPLRAHAGVARCTCTSECRTWRPRSTSSTACAATCRC